MTQREMISKLIAECERAGGVRAFSRSRGISPSLVSMTITGVREPSEAVANAIGLMRRVEYVEVRAGQ